jgi:hypothetical protein
MLDRSESVKPLVASRYRTAASTCNRSVRRIRRREHPVDQVSQPSDGLDKAPQRARGGRSLLTLRRVCRVRCMSRDAIFQTPWQPSVVSIGDWITGQDVTFTGAQRTGTVSRIIGPIASPDCGGFRYQLTDTGDYYANGNPVEPIVYAERWADA